MKKLGFITLPRDRLYIDAQERKLIYEEIQKLDREKRMFCSMLYWTGASLSEPLGLTHSSIDLTSKVVAIETLKL